MTNPSPRKERENPETPDTYAQVYKDRRKAEPAAAALETDGEAGGNPPRPANGTPPGDADDVRTKGDVRAGPGDAGAQNAPRVLDQPRNKPPRDRRVLIAGLAAGVVLLLLFYALAG